jgi:predicted nucleic acid-binding protein
MFVLDCSATMAWFFEDEATDYAQAILDTLAAGEIAVVPSLWLLEVTKNLSRKNRVYPYHLSVFKFYLKNTYKNKVFYIII